MSSKYDPYVNEIHNLVHNEGWTTADAARHVIATYDLDVNPETARKEFSKRLKQMSETQLESDVLSQKDKGAVANTETFDATESKAVWSAKVTTRITTLEEALTFCNVDLSIWKVERWTFNKWEVKSKESDAEELYQVKVFFVRKDSSDAFFNSVDGIKEIVGDYKVEPSTAMYTSYEDGILLEICAYDVHYGQLAWAPECGVNYDTKIIREKLLHYMEQLLKKASGFKVNKILFTLGNDYFNSDTLENTTTAGTPQQEDGRWMKTFSEGTKLLIDIIEMLAEVAPVDVVLVQGNHDWQRSFFAMKVLEERYMSWSNINIIVNEYPRKYYKYGKNLIGLTHGKDEKEDELPMIMAQEQPQMWAETIYREWHLGHLHHERKKITRSTQEYRGVTVQRLRSFQPTDSWHTQKAFNGSLNSIYAIGWHPEEGNIIQMKENIKFGD